MIQFNLNAFDNDSEFSLFLMLQFFLSQSYRFAAGENYKGEDTVTVTAVCVCICTTSHTFSKKFEGFVVCIS
jgi:hypothetical protein